MFFSNFWKAIDRQLQGQPDQVISVLLVATALFGIGVALWGPRPLKLVVLGWWWVP